MIHLATLVCLTLGSIDVHPSTVSLEGGRDRQRLVVVDTDLEGLTRDVSASLDWTVTDPAIARVEMGPKGAIVLPLADGDTTLTAAWDDETLSVPLTVRGATDDPPLSFELDVLPVLTARGCNTGECHGSARGQDGFQLSLFGYDPKGDWHRLVKEIPGRRLNRAFPGRSLVVEKAIGAVPHTGGRRIEPGSTDEATLLRWIAEGARPDSETIPGVASIELLPPSVVLRAPGETMGLALRANFTDGTSRDVTDLALIRTTNEVGLSIEEGRVTGLAPGEAFVTASYEAHTVGVPVIVLDGRGDFEYHDPAGPARTEIDRLVEVKLRTLRLNPAPICSDSVFIRRVHLDLTGTLPEPDEIRAFVADTSVDKRDRLVDHLLSQKAFSDLQVMRWAERLQIRSNNTISEKAALRYFEWLRASIERNTPVNEMVREILTASGGTFESPATNFFVNQEDTLVLSENVAQAFMGIRMQCAQCHNHPFDRWTQDDYYGFAAFFARIGRKRAEDPRELVIFSRGGGETTHPVTGQPSTPRFLGGEEPDIGRRDRREVLAEWLTSPDNPYFARSIVNRLWADLMGVGIIDPVDDFQVSNPPSNEPLLDELARRLLESDYDVRRLVRDICVSNAYQRATMDDESISKHFGAARVRRIRAETMLDIISQVTRTPEKYKGLPLGARAVEIADGTTSNYFLDTFGRAPRDTVCACEVSVEPSLSQSLHLMNGRTIGSKIAGGQWDAGLLEAADDEVVTTLFLRTFCREPTDAELERVLGILADAPDRRQGFEDLLWSLLNAREFIFNH